MAQSTCGPRGQRAYEAGWGQAPLFQGPRSARQEQVCPEPASRRESDPSPAPGAQCTFKNSPSWAPGHALSPRPPRHCRPGERPRRGAVLHSPGLGGPVSGERNPSSRVWGPHGRAGGKREVGKEGQEGRGEGRWALPWAASRRNLPAVETCCRTWDNTEPEKEKTKEGHYRQTIDPRDRGHVEATTYLSVFRGGHTSAHAVSVLPRSLQGAILRPRCRRRSDRRT